MIKTQNLFKVIDGFYSNLKRSYVSLPRLDRDPKFNFNFNDTLIQIQN